MMKKRIIQAFVLMMTLIIIVSCKKSSDSFHNSVGSTTNSVEVTTYMPQSVTSNSAVCGGEYSVTQGCSLTLIGICWNKNGNPTAYDSHMWTTNCAESFLWLIDNLEYDTKYYIKAFAVCDTKYFYGEEIEFTTLKGLPVVSTQDVYNVTLTTAVCKGEVLSDGGSSITERGVCWSKFPKPTIDDDHTSDSAGMGSYTTCLTDLESGANYYVRAYAINSAGVGYGAQLTFHTFLDPNNIPGAVGGLFSIGYSNTRRIYFSQGNLQYKASTNIWRFAENQWDYIGEDNANISLIYDGWVDLFGWGTGSNPINLSSNPNDYSTYIDWGYNLISNGGNAVDIWRTLEIDEWNHLLNTRITNSGIRYAKANVKGCNGVILLPDDWNVDNYILNNANVSNASFNSNIITLSEWVNRLEAHGAVFIPAAGCRSGTTLYVVGSFGCYWSASAWSNSNYARAMAFDDDEFWNHLGERLVGFSVRLVCSAE